MNYYSKNRNQGNLRKTETIIYFCHLNKKVPVLKVVDNKIDQVILAFISFKGEHATFHLENDGKILATYSSRNKPKSTWDAERVGIARKLGYKNPEKHGQYYFHQYVNDFSKCKDWFLVSRLLNLSDFMNKNYRNSRKLYFNVPSEKFTLLIKFYYEKIDRNDGVGTSIGTIIFDFQSA